MVDGVVVRGCEASGDEKKDVDVNLGLSGDVNVERLDAVLIGDGVEDVDVEVLRKTRAGGN